MADEVEVYPSQFEAYMDGFEVFNIKSMDEATATLEIKSGVNVELWDEIAPKIRDCLLQMKLEGDKLA
jgi:hypothetical protein